MPMFEQAIGSFSLQDVNDRNYVNAVNNPEDTIVTTTTSGSTFIDPYSGYGFRTGVDIRTWSDLEQPPVTIDNLSDKMIEYIIKDLLGKRPALMFKLTNSYGFERAPLVVYNMKDKENAILYAGRL